MSVVTKTPAVGFRANAFERRNLVVFLLIAFGWSWSWWALFVVNHAVGRPSRRASSASIVDLPYPAGARDEDRVRVGRPQPVDDRSTADLPHGGTTTFRFGLPQRAPIIRCG